MLCLSRGNFADYVPRFLFNRSRFECSILCDLAARAPFRGPHSSPSCERDVPRSDARLWNIHIWLFLTETPLQNTMVFLRYGGKDLNESLSFNKSCVLSWISSPLTHTCLASFEYFTNSLSTFIQVTTPVVEVLVKGLNCLDGVRP